MRPDSDRNDQPPSGTQGGFIGNLHAERLAAVSLALAWVSGLMAVLGVLGWLLESPSVAGRVGGQPMAPLTAVILFVITASYLASRQASRWRDARDRESPSRRLPTLIAVGLAAIMVAGVLTVYALASDPRFQRLVSLENDAGFPALPALNTALALGAVVGAMLIRVRDDPTRRQRVVFALLGALALVTAGVVIIGYAYGERALRGLGGSNGMALASGVAIASLSLALMFEPRGPGFGPMFVDRDAGAVLARLLLPAIVLIPFMLGIAQILGENAGWFDAPLGNALRTIAEVIVFAAVMVVAYRWLRRLDADRDRLMMEEREARLDAQASQMELEEQAQELEEQAVELETTVDELRVANESLDVEREAAIAARAAEASARALLDAVVDQLPVGVVIARVPSGEIVRRNRMGADIAAAFTRSGAGEPDGGLTWYRSDGAAYDVADFPLHRTVRDLEVIQQEEMSAWLSDGSRLHLTVSVSPVFEHGEATLAVAVYADTTRRRATEQALAERESLLAAISNSPHILISVMEADVSDAGMANPDRDYRFVYANPQGAAAFGRTDREVIGRSGREIGLPVDRRRSMLDVLAQVRRTGQPLILERPGLPSPDTGRPTAWFSILVNPLADVPGRLPRFCLISTEVTRQRHLEEQLRQSQKLESIGRLAGGIAHDFNNLLTAITGFTRFALADVPEQSSAREDLDQALRAAERAGALTHQLLAFSRQQVLQPQVLDLNHVVTSIEPMLRRVIGEDVAIRQALAPTLGMVRADRGQIEQVLVNLVVNARDAMPDGGLLTLETSDIYLEEAQAETIPGAREGSHVMLSVADTGTGMSAETRERIFEPFFTTKEPGRGTGLGLSTVFGIVRQSGGSIWVYSEPGRGSTFKIYLPRYEGPADASRPATAAPAVRAAGRVLLVEDDRAVRTIAARILRRAGYEVVEATDGREALETYRGASDRIDVILTDLVLPHLGGRALIQAIASEGTVPAVVYMSGYTAEAMSAQSVLEPGDQFIEKPFTADGLVAKLREAMQNAAREPRRAG